MKASEATMDDSQLTDGQALRSTADLLGEIGEALAAAGFEAAARQLYLAASEVGLKAEAGDEWWTGPFNRQEGRTKLFLAILDSFRPSVLVETGTFKGTTTQFMAQVFPGRILTCEINLRWFIEAQARLSQHPNVELRRQDSRAFLRDVSKVLGSDERAFFYLDAHWLDDLPLRGEIEFILDAWPNAVVMIDDFQVFDDAGYAYDDYGPGNALTLDLLRGLERFSIFFPALPSRLETGARRGCAVLASSNEAADALHHTSALRPFPWPAAPAGAPAPATSPNAPVAAARAEAPMPDQFGALRALVQRLASIPELHARIAEIEADREARLAVIQGARAHIAEIEADREARLAVIQGARAHIAELEAEREARLAVIQGAQAHIAELEAERERSIVRRLSRLLKTLRGSAASK
jgi:hypothetical protein